MRWMVFFAVLLTAQYAMACGPCEEPSILKHVTLADPASYRLVYTGIGGLLFDEYVDFIGTKWLSDISYYQFANELELTHRSRYALNAILDYGANKYADKREHWWHYSTHWNWRSTYTTGPIRDVINIGPFRVSNKFKFKLKSYKASLTNKWSFKFKPRVTFTSKLPLIKTLLLYFSFTYRLHGKKIFRVTLSAGANFKRRDGELNLEIDFLGWGS